MTYYPTYCSSYQYIWRSDKQQIRALNTCHLSPFAALVDYSNNIFSYTSNKYIEKLGNYIYMMHLLSELSDLDLHATAIPSQCLFKVFWQNWTVKKIILVLFSTFS